MKRLMFIAACCVFFGAGTAYAQQDTTKKQTPTQVPSDKMRDDMTGWTKVEASEVPSQLRTTLSESKYKGWENGTVYKNQNGDVYSLQIGEGAGRKTHYFDKDGKMTKRPNKVN